jgi:phage protein U
MTNVMMQLGGFQFSIDTAAYQSVKRSTSYRWPKQPRIGQRQQLQNIGPGEDGMMIQGVIYTTYERGGGAPGVYQVEQLRQIQAQGEPQMLTDGTGNVFGMWCITAVDETSEAFFNNGAPRKQTFSINIERYGDEGGEGGGLLSQFGFSGTPFNLWDLF